MREDRLLERIRRKRQNVHFNDFVRLVEAMGFEEERQTGSHRIFAHRCGAVLNLQNDHGRAKPYQIREFLNAVDSYGLRLP